MSSLVTAHMLIVVGIEDAQVLLCVIASWAFAHASSDHRDGVITFDWFTSTEWVLVTRGMWWCNTILRHQTCWMFSCFRSIPITTWLMPTQPKLSSSTSQWPGSAAFWSCHDCSFDAHDQGCCPTGDCSSSLFCNVMGGAPLTTLAKTTLGLE